MDVLARIGERRIAEAVERGELDHNPLAGRPLPLEDLDKVPAELRGAYTVLKNAGALPPELEARKEILGLQALLHACTRDTDLDACRLRLARLQLHADLLRDARLQA